VNGKGESKRERERGGERKRERERSRYEIYDATRQRRRATSDQAFLFSLTHTRRARARARATLSANTLRSSLSVHSRWRSRRPLATLVRPSCRKLEKLPSAGRALTPFSLSAQRKQFSDFRPSDQGERKEEREREREKEKERKRGCRPLPKYFGRPFGSGIGPYTGRLPPKVWTSIRRGGVHGGADLAMGSGGKPLDIYGTTPASGTRLVERVISWAGTDEETTREERAECVRAAASTDWSTIAPRSASAEPVSAAETAHSLPSHPPSARHGGSPRICALRTPF